MEDVSSGYSSTEFLPVDSASALDNVGVVRRNGSIRQSSRVTRPVTMVEKSSKTGASGSDVSYGCSVDSRLIQLIDFIEDEGSRLQKRQAEGCH